MTVFEIVVHRNVGYKLDTIIDMMSLVDQSQGHICKNCRLHKFAITNTIFC